eukprot:scaffold607_cov111-Skeletonema_menzelii.AAC.2
MPRTDRARTAAPAGRPAQPPEEVGNIMAVKTSRAASQADDPSDKDRLSSGRATSYNLRRRRF